MQDVARDGKELRSYTSPQQDDKDKVKCCACSMSANYSQLQHHVAGTELLFLAGLTGLTVQAVREVQQQLFGLSTQVTQLRRDVDRLGTAQDTGKLRQKIADANQNSTSSAKSIGQRLNSLHAEHKTQQTGRLVSSFEVCRQCVLCTVLCNKM